MSHLRRAVKTQSKLLAIISQIIHLIFSRSNELQSICTKSLMDYYALVQFDSKELAQKIIDDNWHTIDADDKKVQFATPQEEASMVNILTFHMYQFVER